MVFFDWTDDLNIGIPEIDVQHQQLVRLMNRLSDAMSQGKGLSVLDGALDELSDYADCHFRSEEHAFALYHYNDAAAHIRKHNEFRKQLGELRAKFELGGIGVTTQLMTFLKDWLTSHIKGDDQRYAAFIKRGV